MLVWHLWVKMILKALVVPDFVNNCCFLSSPIRHAREVAVFTYVLLTQEGSTNGRFSSLVFKPALSAPVDEGILMSS